MQKMIGMPRKKLLPKTLDIPTDGLYYGIHNIPTVGIQQK